MQNKTKRNILLFVIAAFLVLVVIALVNFYPMLVMRPMETGGIEGTSIISVRNSINNMFFIQSDSGYIAIDAGTNKDAIEKTLAELSINPSDIRYLLLTHSDYDHVGSLATFSNAQLLMSEDEWQMVSGVTKRNQSKYNSLPAGVDMNSVELLADGQELSLDGQSVRCMKTPGHTPGSMSYLIDGKYLFTGDAVRIKGNRLLVHPFTMDEKEAQITIEMLMAAKESYSLLFTAHYGYHGSEELE